MRIHHEKNLFRDHHLFLNPFTAIAIPEVLCSCSDLSSIQVEPDPIYLDWSPAPPKLQNLQIEISKAPKPYVLIKTYLII